MRGLGAGFHVRMRAIRGAPNALKHDAHSAIAPHGSGRCCRTFYARRFRFRSGASPDFAHFSYDKSAPLNVKQVSAKVQNGVTIEDITYTGVNGDTVPAYLVIPNGAGKFAGILWGHWLMDGAANSNRTEFLDEAIALAPSGVVSLLIDAPQIAPTSNCCRA